MLETLSVVAQYDLTLGTGHVTPAEAFMIMREARKRGVQRMIVTPPTLGLGGTMTTEQLQEAAKLGALAAKALRGAGFTEKELNLMFKDNPAKLVKLPVL